MLEVRGLRASYGETPVLEGIDLSVGDGEFVAVIGPNGHGKTTLLRTLSGLLEPTTGEISFDGERIDGLRPDLISMRGLVHIPQGDLPFGDMTVEENLLLGAFPADAWRKRSERLERVFTLFPVLAERRTQRARTLSGGERRMLALGRGLMGDARMLMIACRKDAIVRSPGRSPSRSRRPGARRPSPAARSGPTRAAARAHRTPARG